MYSNVYTLGRPVKDRQNGVLYIGPTARREPHPFAHPSTAVAQKNYDADLPETVINRA